MKLTYWICVHDDNPTYNLRARTKKELLKLLESYSAEEYDPPVKHTINYANAFDLAEICLAGSYGNEPMSKKWMRK